jgi:hypothetical protein
MDAIADVLREDSDACAALQEAEEVLARTAEVRELLMHLTATHRTEERERARAAFCQSGVICSCLACA